MVTTFAYDDGRIVKIKDFDGLIADAESEFDGNCSEALKGLGFHLSSEYYPSGNIEGMGIQVYSNHVISELTKRFDFLVTMCACDTSSQYVLIKDNPSLFDFLAKYLPVIKLAGETSIDRETHYEKV